VRLAESWSAPQRHDLVLALSFQQEAEGKFNRQGRVLGGLASQTNVTGPK